LARRGRGEKGGSVSDRKFGIRHPSSASYLFSARVENVKRRINPLRVENKLPLQSVKFIL